MPAGIRVIDQTLLPSHRDYIPEPALCERCFLASVALLVATPPFALLSGVIERQGRPDWHPVPRKGYTGRLLVILTVHLCQ